MADYDRRGPRRGGGQFNNRKRRYRDDDFEDRRPQRRRFEEPLSVTLRKMVLSIAEDRMRRVEDDVPYIAKSIGDNYFDSDLTSGFVDLVAQMTVEQPFRIPFIAAIILHMNTHKPEFTPEILKKISEILQKHVNAGSWREAKLYMRLLGCFQGMFEGDGIFPLLEQFFERAADLQMQSSEDSLGLELVKIILLTIPYTMTSSATGLETLANSLLEKTDVIASTPHALESLVDPFPSLEAGGATSSESALALLQQHMQEESKANWELTCLPRPWKIPRAEGEEDPLPSAQKHSFPDISLPQTILSGPHPIYPEIYFSVYSDQDISTVPPSTDTSALLIRDACTDTISALDFNRSATARFLIEIDCFFAPNTFVKRATPFDKIRDVATDKTMWKPEDVVVDACFALLFSLPAPEHKLIYYHSVLTEACKLAPAAVAPSLGRAIRFLYRSVDRMDLELAHRFLDWFTHHLSNFGFTWKWTEWVSDVELSELTPKKAFIVDALDKEIRLSFAQRIRGTLPPEVAGMIDASKEVDVPEFRYNDEHVAFSGEAKEIAQLIRKKGVKEDFEPIIARIEEQGGRMQVIEVFVTAICWVGSKSLSHLLACVERCKEILLGFTADGTEAEKKIVESILAFWGGQVGNGVMVVDKFVNYLIISPESVVEAVLGDSGYRGQGGKVLSEGWVWEIISKVTGKVTGRVKGVVHAVRKPGLDEEKRNEMQDVLETEMAKMRALFAQAQNCVAELGEPNGKAWAMNMSDEDAALVRMWAAKWLRAFGRRANVEEAWVREELAKPIPEPEPEVVQVKEDKQGDVVMNGEERAGKKVKVDGEGEENGVKDEDMEAMGAIE